MTTTDLWTYRDQTWTTEGLDGYSVEAIDGASARSTRPATTSAQAISWSIPAPGSSARRCCCRPGVISRVDPTMRRSTSTAPRIRSRTRPSSTTTVPRPGYRDLGGYYGPRRPAGATGRRPNKTRRYPPIKIFIYIYIYKKKKIRPLSSTASTPSPSVAPNRVVPVADALVCVSGGGRVLVRVGVFAERGGVVAGGGGVEEGVVESVAAAGVGGAAAEASGNIERGGTLWVAAFVVGGDGFHGRRGGDQGLPTVFLSASGRSR